MGVGVSWPQSSSAGRSRQGRDCGAQAEESQSVATVTTGDPRIRYAAAVLRACENDDLPLIRALFAGAAAEVFTLRGLLPRSCSISPKSTPNSMPDQQHHTQHNLTKYY